MRVCSLSPSPSPRPCPPPHPQLSSGLLGLGARRVQRLPPELLPLATALFNYQRGRMLSPHAHPCERALRAAQLLACGSQACWRLLHPCLLAVAAEQGAGGGTGRGEAGQGAAEGGRHGEGGVQMALVEVAPLDVVGYAALVAGAGQQQGGRGEGGAAQLQQPRAPPPPLLLDAGVELLLLPAQQQEQQHEAAAGGASSSSSAGTTRALVQVALEYAAHKRPTPELRLVRGLPATPPGPLTDSVQQQQQHADVGAAAATASAQELLSLLQPVHADPPDLQRAQLRAGSSLTEVLVPGGGGEAGAEAVRAGIAQLGVPPAASLVQWCSGLGVELPMA